ncbi:MAG: hypothetical protein A2Y10_03140 [Planctomycetes bacterium GWF2_41_51]|nr:MAG: hypothetical protein A2Y10_03140 [Planctomycetes bacterium GWF2_41_51]HBG28269.1 hypothetical protein [Phycisphaerales bacterium]
MAKINFLLVITIIMSAIAWAEPIVSYETDPKPIYTNMQNSWWEQSYSTFRNHIPGTAGDQNGKILNSYLASNVDNLDLGDAAYARVQDSPSWSFSSSSSKARPAANYSNGINSVSARRRRSNDDSGFVSSSSDLGPEMVAGGYYTGTLFRDPRKRRSSSNNNNYYYYYTIPGTDTPPDIVTPDVPVAPAPGSILLGTIGIAIVGFLKNRKTKILS